MSGNVLSFLCSPHHNSGPDILLHPQLTEGGTQALINDLPELQNQ